MFIRLCVFIFAAALFLLQGCVAMQSFPTVARAGDTITLALGSVDDLNKSKIQISYVPQSTGVPIDITPNIRSILKIYPDRSSTASMADTWTAPLTVYSGHALWMNIAVIDLPAALPTGPGYFQVDFADSVRVPNTASVEGAEGKHIAAEILAGSGAPSVFSYFTTYGGSDTGDFKRLEPLPRVVLRPAASNLVSGISTSHPAAAEFRIKLPVSGDVSTMDDSEIHVIWDYKPGEDSKQIQLSWRRTVDVIVVNILIPTSITVNEQLMQFSIVVNPAINNNRINMLGVPELLSYRYFDLNGNEYTPRFTPEVVVMK